jgi:hypothetical protein
MLEIGNEKGILEGAFKCIGVTSFPQKNHTIQHCKKPCTSNGRTAETITVIKHKKW